jgi:TRAP transporter TAXI family solute receptor
MASKVMLSLLNRDAVRIGLGIVVALAAAIALALWWAGPPPPKHIRIATGEEGGAYAVAGARFKEVLEREGVKVTLVPSAGSVQNLALLTDADRTARVDVAIVQSGVGAVDYGDEVASLGALFLEPAWIFGRNLGPGQDMQRLRGKRVAMGPEGSGARKLGLLLLAENGMREEDLTILPLSGPEASTALIRGEIDGAFIVGGTLSSWVSPLIAAPNVELVSFSRADAYQKRLPFLAAVTLHEGVISPGVNLPRKDTQLVAPVGQLVVRKELHPAVQGLLMESSRELFGRGDALSAPGAFPDPKLVDLALSEQAKRYYERGPGFLRRYLPYWAANLVERLAIIALPALTLLLPLVRAAPGLYRWRVRRRIYIWYRDLRALEAAGAAAKSIEEKMSVRLRLDSLLFDVGRISVPLPYTDDLYRLRSHILFVRSILDGDGPGGAALNEAL